MRKKPIDYIVLRGKIDVTTAEIQQYIKAGWDFNGETQTFLIDRQLIIVQPLALYCEEK